MQRKIIFTNPGVRGTLDGVRPATNPLTRTESAEVLGLARSARHMARKTRKASGGHRPAESSYYEGKAAAFAAAASQFGAARLSGRKTRSFTARSYSRAIGYDFNPGRGSTRKARRAANRAKFRAARSRSRR